MPNKRLIGVVTVKNGWAVQSFGYRRYLPLGKPEVLVHNLDRWGADEILLQCIDRSHPSVGPDFELLRKVSDLGISTPLIYSGGIRGREDALKVVSFGADRVMIDALLKDAPADVEAVSRVLGLQAVIANLPIRNTPEGLLLLDYRSGHEMPLAEAVKLMPLDWISELMLTDWCHEGHSEAFSTSLLAASDLLSKPLICFGGISSAHQIRALFENDRVVAIGGGNSLNYKEHAIQALKKDLVDVAIRPPNYESSTQ
jgi:cyclase